MGPNDHDYGNNPIVDSAGTGRVADNSARNTEVATATNAVVTGVRAQVTSLQGTNGGGLRNLEPSLDNIKLGAGFSLPAVTQTQYGAPDAATTTIQNYPSLAPN